MGAGKSLDLLKTAYNYEERDKNVILFTSSLDNRYGTKKISSRVGISRDAYVFDESTNIYDFVKENCYGCECVLIDESQFLTKDQVWQLTSIVDELECDVIAYGLRSDFKAEPFEGSIYLMTWADEKEELKTVCKYGDKASMNMRLNNDASAAGYAMQICDTPRMVTVSIDQCNFERPAKESQLLKIYGYPTKIGNTSITLYMEARAHSVYTGKQDLVLKTNITFVQIDEGGNPIPLGDKSRKRINEMIS